jgi:hypothetical protein
MSQLNIANVQEFLKELGELSRKYQIGIQGCALCEAPYLFEIEGQSDKVYGVTRHYYEYLVFEHPEKIEERGFVHADSE